MKHRIKPLEKYIKEGFYNPFDEDNAIKTTPSHIADKGGLFKMRKEIFNINRVEYSKKKNGAYVVLAKTQFARGEIVEIAPVIFVGPEAKNISRLKDHIFEIDKNNSIYGVVLGYGSLYGHSETPNITFAYNKQNRQMYFIAAKTINAAEQLTINYGKDYWAERLGFGTMAPNQFSKTEDSLASKGETIETSESMAQPNAEDITNMSATKQFGQPNSTANPAVSGVAIKSAGQK